jgi:hypothetical protein
MNDNEVYDSFTNLIKILVTNLVMLPELSRISIYLMIKAYVETIDKEIISMDEGIAELLCRTWYLQKSIKQIQYTKELLVTA